MIDGNRYLNQEIFGPLGMQEIAKLPKPGDSAGYNRPSTLPVQKGGTFCRFDLPCRKLRDSSGDFHVWVATLPYSAFFERFSIVA